MKVKTECEGCEYITAGKEYEIIDREGDYGAYIEVDDGWVVFILIGHPLGCGWLHETGTWEVIE